MQKVYSSWSTDGVNSIDVSDLTALNTEDMFGNIDGGTDALNSFLEVLQDVGSTAEDVQDAFDELSTKYIYQTDLTEAITLANRKWAESELSKANILNKSNVAESMLLDKYSAEEVILDDISNGLYNLSKDFIISSDIYGYIDADYTIIVKEAGNLEISLYNGDVLDRTFIVANCTAGEVITITGQTQIIQSNVANHNLGKDSNFLFPRLVNTFSDYDDEVHNKLISSLNCSVQISYNPAIRIGYGYMG